MQKKKFVIFLLFLWHAIETESDKKNKQPSYIININTLNNSSKEVINQSTNLEKIITNDQNKKNQNDIHPYLFALLGICIGVSSKEYLFFGIKHTFFMIKKAYHWYKKLCDT